MPLGLVLLGLALLAACGTEDGGGTPDAADALAADAFADGATDGATDTAADIAADTAADVLRDAPGDAPADSTGDVPPDAPGDVSLDPAADSAPELDAARDTAAEVDADSDTAGDAGDADPDVVADCELGPAGTSFGITIRTTLDRCVFTRAELTAGVELAYSIEVEASDTLVWSRPLDAGGCARPGSSGLRILERVSGGDQSWCICDSGLCMAPTPEFVALEPGTYAGSITWDGRNWFGPSDFGNPPGDPFPAGEYIFSVRAAGQYRTGDGATPSWDITATARVVVVE